MITHIFNTVSKYDVLDYCRCGDPCCSTVYLHSPALINRDGTFAQAYTTCWIIINFYPDGKLEIESLADREEYIFLFKQEILDVFAGKELGYSSTLADQIVEKFIEKLKRQEVKRIEV